MDSGHEIVSHYEERYEEDARLARSPVGRLEQIRTRAILNRQMPQPPASVLDVGGGPGAYATVLNDAGYDVELIDIVPLHIRQATERGVRAQLGDARELPVGTNTQDAVLLLGPLYHLTERADRLTALGEAIRVGRSGAPVFVAAISRYASALDGLDRGFWDDPAFAEIALADLETGRHVNTTGNPAYFTTAFFHHPDELRNELREAGFQDVEVLAVEGIGWLAGDLEERLNDVSKRSDLLHLLELLELECSILGASPHLLGVGRVP